MKMRILYLVNSPTFQGELFTSSALRELVYTLASSDELDTMQVNQVEVAESYPAIYKFNPGDLMPIYEGNV